MTRTLQLQTRIPESRELVICVPRDVPSGDAQIVVKITSGEPSRPSTLGDLQRSEFFGMWRDRKDIQDSLEYARELRKTAWSRSGR